MKTDRIYFKYLIRDNGVIKERQRAAVIISVDYENDIIIAKYMEDNKEIQRAFCEGQYSLTPYIVSY